MKLFGITGGIGMGKSMSFQFLTQWGVPVVDTDLLARQLVDPGQPALAEIVSTFGPELLDDAGRLRRSVLAKLVFEDESRRKQLEAILHPRIRAAWLAEVERWRREHRTLGAIIIPLLFETDAAQHFDCVVSLACQAQTQRRRLAERGWSNEEIDRRNASQWPVQKKIELSHRVIWTEPAVAVHGAQLRRIIGQPTLS